MVNSKALSLPLTQCLHHALNGQWCRSWSSTSSLVGVCTFVFFFVFLLSSCLCGSGRIPSWPKPFLSTSTSSSAHRLKGRVLLYLICFFTCFVSFRCPPHQSSRLILNHHCLDSFNSSIRNLFIIVGNHRSYRLSPLLSWGPRR